MEGTVTKNNPIPSVQKPEVQANIRNDSPVIAAKSPAQQPKPPPLSHKKGIILLKKGGFDYYDEIRDAVVTFPYPANSVSDLEILDKEGLEMGIGQFIDQNKLTPVTIFIIFSESTIFEKIIETATTKDPQEMVIQSFLDNVPFEHVAYKTYNTSNGYRICAVNEDLFKDIDEVMEKKGFVVTFAISDFLTPELTGKDILDTATAKSLLGKSDQLKKQALIVDGIREVSETGYIIPQSKKEVKEKSSLPILLPVFGVLVFILFFVIFLQLRQKAKASPVPQTIIAPTVFTPTETPTETPVPATPSATPRTR